MRRPAVSVLTAVTRPDLLIPLHESLCAQTVSWEWLLQLDGPAISVAGSICFHDKRVKVEVNPHSLGSATTRNRALLRATAPFVICIDDDDLVCENALRHLVDAVDAHPRCFGAWGRTWTFSVDPAVRQLFKAWPAEGVLPPGTIGSLFESKGRLAVHVGSMLWRREHLVAFGGYAALSRSIDTNVFLACEALFPSYYVDADIYLYRRHKAQMTREVGYARAKEATHRYNFERASALRRLVRPRLLGSHPSSSSERGESDAVGAP